MSYISQLYLATRVKHADATVKISHTFPNGALNSFETDDKLLLMSPNTMNMYMVCAGLAGTVLGMFLSNVSHTWQFVRVAGGLVSHMVGKTPSQ